MTGIFHLLFEVVNHLFHLLTFPPMTPPARHLLTRLHPPTRPLLSRLQFHYHDLYR